MKRILVAVALGCTAIAQGLAQAPVSERLKVGLLATLSGPPAALGQQARNGFELALKDLGGKLGGRDIDLVVQDDELKPDVGVGKARTLVEREKVAFVVGPTFSNILGAVMRPITAGGAILISPNAGPSSSAGKDCNPNFFVTSYQNDQVHEVLGHYAQDAGIKRAFIIAPNYQAGRDALAGFKRDFRGEVVDEAYVPLNQLDYAAELSKIAAARPDAIFAFLPGGMGVNFVKQFRQAGLAESVKFLSAFTVDETNLPAQGDAALGFFSGSNWAPNLDVAANHRFVAAYERAYGAVPASYAFHAYDAALLIDSALRSTGGDVSNKDALRAALRRAEFSSLRGAFRFNTNQYPIQDFYLVKVAKRPDGKLQTEVVQKVFANYADTYAKDCPLR